MFVFCGSDARQLVFVSLVSEVDVTVITPKRPACFIAAVYVVEIDVTGTTPKRDVTGTTPKRPTCFIAVVDIASVSDTHLTLPTILRVKISVRAGSLRRKTENAYQAYRPTLGTPICGGFDVGVVEGLIDENSRGGTSRRYVRAERCV